MSGFLGGLITGIPIGVVVTLLVLMIVAGTKGPGDASTGPVQNRKVFLPALVLLAVCGVCYTFELEKSALLALLLSVLLLAKLGGSKRGLVAAGIAAVMLAWFLPPNGSLTVTGLDNRIALAFFVLGTVVGSIGRKSMAQALDYDLGSGPMISKDGAGGGNRNIQRR